MAIWEEANRLGVEVHIAGSLRTLSESADWWVPREPSWGTIHRLRPVQIGTRSSMAFWYYRGLSTVIRNVEPDIVHVRSELWGIVVAQALAARRPVVVHGAENQFTHGSKFEAELRMLQVRRALRSIAAYASWNKRGLDLAQRFGFDQGKPALVAPAEIPNPEPFVQAGSSDSERSLDMATEEPMLIGFLGRLERQKGVHVLMKAFEHADLDNAVLEVYGSGVDERSLRRSAMKLDKQVVFRGAVSPSEVPTVLARLDLLVVPSLTTRDVVEQFGRVAVEAMFSRTAVLVSDSGALPEVVGEAGVVVPEGQVQELKEALEVLERNIDLREHLADLGQKTALARYSPRHLAEHFVDLWEKVTFESSGN